MNYNSIYENNTDNSIIFISKDGVCFIEIKEEMLKNLFPEITQDEIKNYQESTWLTDIDNMNEFEFSNYLQYIFQGSNIEFQKEQKVGSYKADYVISFERKNII